LPGGGRRVSAAYPASFRPPSAPPRHRRQPLLVGADGCPRPPECRVTSPARGRRILLHLRHVSGRRPSSEQDKRTISMDCQTRSIVLDRNIYGSGTGRGRAKQSIIVGWAKAERVSATPCPPSASPWARRAKRAPLPTLPSFVIASEAKQSRNCTVPICRLGLLRLCAPRNDGRRASYRTLTPCTRRRPNARPACPSSSSSVRPRTSPICTNRCN